MLDRAQDYVVKGESQWRFQRPWLSDHTEQDECPNMAGKGKGEDPVKVKARVARYVNSPKGKATRRAYCLAHSKEAVQRVKEWKEQNPERALENRARYYEANKEHVVARVAEWNAANPDGPRTRGRNYRAKLYAAEGSHTREEILALHKAQNGKCVYCRVSLRDAHHADHIVPLSKGGSNWISNIQLTCGPCNNRKRATDPIVFAR